MVNTHLEISFENYDVVFEYMDFYIKNIVDNMSLYEYEYFKKSLLDRYSNYLLHGNSDRFSVPVNGIAHCLPKKIRNTYFVYDSVNCRFVVNTDFYLMLLRY